MGQLTLPGFNEKPCPRSITMARVANYMNNHIEVETTPSRKDIRLAIDLAKQLTPLFEFNIEEHLDVVRRILRHPVSDEQILSTKSFKKIMFVEVITGIQRIGNNKYEVKLKRVIRKRNLQK